MDSLDTNTLFSGILFFGYLVIALFFLRFWTRTRDRLFAMFSGAFALLALQRIAFALSAQPTEDLTMLYVVRLLAFVMILAAIIDKNRSTLKDAA
jgi:hypothetical protein